MKYAFICMLLLLVEISFGQSNIHNFTKLMYGAGSQNWAIQQDEKGNIYVANNEGLLVFNGTKWQIFPVPNQTIVRYIVVDKNNTIYVGGQDEMGYFKPNNSGKLVYTSLLPLLNNQEKQFADIWNIILYNDEVFFRAFSTIFRLHNNKITAYPCKTKWDFLGIHNNKLIALDKGSGLLSFENNQWKELISLNNLPKDLSITAITPLKNQSLLTTVKNGLWTLDNATIKPFTLTGKEEENKQHFTASLAINDSLLLLGTYDNGLYEITKNGVVKNIYTKKEGINSNNIKCIFQDNFKNIWLGLEDGISFLDVNTGIKWFNPKVFNSAAGYGAVKYNNTMYFALANGIYEMPLGNQGAFEMNNSIKKISNGLSWHISNIEGKIFVGQDDGFFEIKEGKPTPIDEFTGYWIFKIIKTNSNNLFFAAGNYLGIALFSLQNGQIKKEVDLSNLNISARFLEYDSLLNAVWISHPYRGIYKISLANYTTTAYTEKEGLPSTLNNHVFKIANEVVVTTINGIYSYNKEKNIFEPSAKYKAFFNNKSIRYLQEDEKGNIWFIQEKNVGFVKNKTNTIVYIPELQSRILSGFEHIYTLNNKTTLIGGEQGFFLVDVEKYFQNKNKPAVFIRNVTAKATKDSVLYGGFYNEITSVVELPYKLNAFHFEFSSPLSSGSNQHILYSFRLKGFDKDWSSWNNKTEKDYTNLPAGNYTFEVKAKNNLNEESAIATYTFKILPAWYNSIYARIIYGLIFITLLYLSYKQQEKKLQQKQEQKILEQKRLHDEKQQMLTYQHQLQMEKAEKEMIQLKNEKLEAELASAAMNLVQKKEFLLKIKDEISKLNKAGKENIDATELKKILRSLTAEDKLDEEWDLFTLHFNKVHGNFLNNLQNKYPTLKAHELKLCAYLRMALSSKEIAQLMSISVRGVEISRYRLRKKLQVPAKEDLFQFLLQIEKGTTS